MEWSEIYCKDNQPRAAEISAYINNPLWDEINIFLHNAYEIEPIYSYSSCSEQPGWNVKYKKAGRSLCTLYPMSGFFIALVVIGTKEQMEAELIMPELSEHIQELYKQSALLSGASWLMIHVTNEKILEDVKKLIGVRRKIKKQGDT